MLCSCYTLSEIFGIFRTKTDKDAMFMLYPFGYKYSANNSNYNLSGIKMPFVTNSIPERVYLWCACRSMRLSAQLFTIFSPCSVLDVIFISIFAIKCTLKLNICNIMQLFNIKRVTCCFWCYNIRTLWCGAFEEIKLFHKYGITCDLIIV